LQKFDIATSDIRYRPYGDAVALNLVDAVIEASTHLAQMQRTQMSAQTALDDLMNSEPKAKKRARVQSEMDVLQEKLKQQRGMKGMLQKKVKEAEAVYRSTIHELEAKDEEISKLQSDHHKLYEEYFQVFGKEMDEMGGPADMCRCGADRGEPSEFCTANHFDYFP
jgi:predicted nuclease with TOPRIM domain